MTVEPSVQAGQVARFLPVMATGLPAPSIDTLPTRISDRITDTGQHWLWTAAMRGERYGTLSWEGRKQYAHRVVYQLLVGPIPEGLQIDHLCRVRACVWPLHLEPVTGRVNVLRGEGPSAVNARKTECDSGHPLSGAFLLIDTAGARRCRECHMLAMRQWVTRQHFIDGQLTIDSVEGNDHAG